MKLKLLQYLVSLTVCLNIRIMLACIANKHFIVKAEVFSFTNAYLLLIFAHSNNKCTSIAFNLAEYQSI